MGAPFVAANHILEFVANLAQEILAGLASLGSEIVVL
jgi:hypothetical protein